MAPFFLMFAHSGLLHILICISPLNDDKPVECWGNLKVFKGVKIKIDLKDLSRRSYLFKVLKIS